MTANAGDGRTSSPPDDLIAVGKIGPARGVHGDVFVEPWTDTPAERFAPGSVLRTRPESAGPLTVESAQVSSGKQVVHFAGVDGRLAVEALRGTELFVVAADRPPIEDPDEFYDTDLVGLVVSTVDGAELGPVTDVLHTGSADYLVVAHDGADRLIPFVTAMVPSVDLAAGTVTVDPPPGLLEL